MPGSVATLTTCCSAWSASRPAAGRARRTPPRAPASPRADRSASEPVHPARAGPTPLSRPIATPPSPSSGDRLGDRDLAVGAGIRLHPPVDLLVPPHHPVDGEPPFDVPPAGERVDRYRRRARPRRARRAGRGRTPCARRRRPPVRSRADLRLLRSCLFSTGSASPTHSMSRPRDGRIRSSKYLRSAGSVHLAAMIRWIPTAFATSIARCTPLSELMRPRNRRYGSFRDLKG